MPLTFDVIEFYVSLYQIRLTAITVGACVVVIVTHSLEPRLANVMAQTPKIEAISKTQTLSAIVICQAKFHINQAHIKLGQDIKWQNAPQFNEHLPFLQTFFSLFIYIVLHLSSSVTSDSHFRVFIYCFLMVETTIMCCFC